MDLISQVWVTVFGLVALGCMQTDRAAVRRWGVVLGLIGQPAWFVQFWLHDQWGMVPVAMGYTLVWLFGAWNLLVRPAMDRVIEVLETEVGDG